MKAKASTAGCLWGFGICPKKFINLRSSEIFLSTYMHVDYESAFTIINSGVK